MRIIIIVLLLGLSVTSLAQRKSDKAYFEDLSGVRPRVQAPADTMKERTNQQEAVKQQQGYTKTVNAKVDAVLDSIDRFNLIRRTVDGFTIQIYSGQKREDAMNTKKNLSAELPEFNSNLQYIQPKFRVTVGKYFTSLEAQPDLIRIRRYFPAAILVPEKIPFR